MTKKYNTLSELFAPFARREIPMVEEEREFQGRPYTQWVADKNDPTIAEMEKLAKDNNVKLRILLPYATKTVEWQPDRLNIYVKKEKDGKFRVQTKFDFG